MSDTNVLYIQADTPDNTIRWSVTSLPFEKLHYDDFEIFYLKGDDKLDRIQRGRRFDYCIFYLISNSRDFRQYIKESFNTIAIEFKLRLYGGHDTDYANTEALIETLIGLLHNPKYYDDRLYDLIIDLSNDEKITLDREDYKELGFDE